MRRIAIWTLAGCISTLALEETSIAASELTVDQVVEKNVAARGGAEAWRKVQNMVWIGHVESANASAPSLPFVLDLKRPNKERFEIRAQTGMSVRMYDGHHGWKMRPKQSGRPDLEPYTVDELSFARNEQVIDGPLIDYAAKGIAVTLDGVDDIEGHRAYRIGVKLPTGTSQHVWIDAQSFLDIKSDSQPQNTHGQSGIVSKFYRNYRTIEGLQIPLTIESSVGARKSTDRMVIEKIMLNQSLDDRMFVNPGTPGRRSMTSSNGDSQRSVQSFLSTSSLPAGLPGQGIRSMPGSVDTR